MPKAGPDLTVRGVIQNMRGNRDGGDFQKELLPGKRSPWSRRSQAGLCAVKPAFAAPFWADVGTERIKRTSTSAVGCPEGRKQ